MVLFSFLMINNAASLHLYFLRSLVSLGKASRCVNVYS